MNTNRGRGNAAGRGRFFHRQQQQRVQRTTFVLEMRQREIYQREQMRRIQMQRMFDEGPSSSGYGPRGPPPSHVWRPTNLDRLMASVTPFVQARFSQEVMNPRTRRIDSIPFFHLQELWESFTEWSAYGVGVPLQLFDEEVEQYFVPSLSGIQLFVDPSRIHVQPSSPDARVGSANNSRGQPLLFEFLEHEKPFDRRPLADKISMLAADQCPALMNTRSCDLLPASWISVAWYPIGRIPTGPTLRSIDACFITFHSLSTMRLSPAQFHAPNTRRRVGGSLDPHPWIALPVFALASYKLRGSIVAPRGPHECLQENALFQAAESWVRFRRVALPDFEFFRAHHSQGR